MTYLSHYAGNDTPETFGNEVIHDWAEFTFRRQCWLYGPERAAAIMVGEDPATEADIAAWNRLGAGRVAA